MSEEWNEIDLNPALPQKEKVEFEVEGQEENEPIVTGKLTITLISYILTNKT